MSAPSLAARLNDALPQTQCTRCGYPDCAAYAQAMADGQADINQCPPGGEAGVARLASITGRPLKPLNPAHGVEGPRLLAVIDENWCIGCTLCIKACPTDAIVGANKRMHTVLDADCTGCELCVPVCPVDCIDLVNASGTATGWQAWSAEQAATSRQRYERRSQRLAAQESAHRAKKLREAEDKLAHLETASRIEDPALLQRKKALIEAALAKARARQPQPD